MLSAAFSTKNIYARFCLKVIGFGAGAHARAVMESLRSSGDWELAGLLDVNSELRGKTVLTALAYPCEAGRPAPPLQMLAKNVIDEARIIDQIPPPEPTRLDAEAEQPF